MDRRDFIKKATMATASAADVTPVSAMLNEVTGSKTCKVLLINGSLLLFGFKFLRQIVDIVEFFYRHFNIDRNTGVNVLTLGVQHTQPIT